MFEEEEEEDMVFDFRQGRRGEWIGNAKQPLGVVG
jgi:hypothetical protein